MEDIDTGKIIESWFMRLRKTGVRQCQFAEMIGMNKGQLSMYMSGKRNPLLENFEKIENQLRKIEKDRR